MVDISGMVPVGELMTSGLENPEVLVQLAAEAEAFLKAHWWCRSVRERFLDSAWGDKVAVFYFQIDPLGNADKDVWIIVGDIPPAYIDTLTCPDGLAALRGYVAAMEEWVEHARMGQSIRELIPVARRRSYRDVPPTPENADLLEQRLRMIRDVVLPGLEAWGAS